MSTSDCDNSVGTSPSHAGSELGMTTRRGSSSSSSHSSVNGADLLGYLHSDHDANLSPNNFTFFEPVPQSVESDNTALYASPDAELVCDKCRWTTFHREHMRLHYRAHFLEEEPIEIQQPTPKRPYQQLIPSAEADLTTPNDDSGSSATSAYYPPTPYAEHYQPSSSSMAVSRTLSYGTTPTHQPLTRTFSLGATTSDNNATPFKFGAYQQSQALDPSYLFHPQQQQQQQLLGSPMSLDGSFTESSPPPPTRAAVRRSDSAPLNTISTNGYYSQQLPHSPIYATGGSHYPLSPISPISPEGYGPSAGLHPSLGSRRQSAPSPASLSPSQAALQTASSMNRLLSSSSFLHSQPDLQQRRHTIHEQQHQQSGSELLHLHHTPASSAAYSHHYFPTPSSPPEMPRQQPQMPTMRQQHNARQHERYRTSRAAGPGDVGPERGHACHQCERIFKRLEHLRRHERTHTSEKPFGCDWDGCGRFFSRSDNLTQHKKTHEKVGGRNGPGGRSTKRR
ncbi:hypothetical protein RQP46_002802 [Phenoliferia psychrophenolica]